MGAFDHLTSASLYGSASAMPPSASSDVMPGIAVAAGPTPQSGAPFYSPQHPLFVFGLLLAAAAGLVGVAGSARFGPARAAAALGKA